MMQKREFQSRKFKIQINLNLFFSKKNLKRKCKYLLIELLDKLSKYKNNLNKSNKAKSKLN